MSYARSLHPNAPPAPEGRRRMVSCVIDQGWTVTATAERFQVDAKTVRKWRDRFLSEGVAMIPVLPYPPGWRTKTAAKGVVPLRDGYDGGRGIAS